MKRTKLFAATIIVFGMMAFTTSCSKESVGTEIEKQDIPTCIVENCSLSVNNAPITRTTVDGDLKVKFQDGDRLWCVAKDTYGIIAGLGYLTLESGAGTNAAIFSGEYAYKNGATIKEFNYMLLGANTEAYEIKTVADRSISWVTQDVRQWPFPTDNPLPAEICPDLQDAVERFGVFSCKVEAEKRPENITLAQEKSFINFDLGFDPNTGITGGDDVEFSCMFTTSQRHMFPSYTAELTNDASVNFVLPMDCSFSRAQIIIPRENIAALAVKFGKAENTLAPGSVYSVQKTATNVTLLRLDKDMPTGIIGIGNGDVEGIIVDLGKNGRVVVDVKNIGASGIDDPGDFCGWGSTYDQGNGWKAISRDVFNDLFALDHSWNADRGGGAEFHFDVQGFSTTSTLFLPAAGYDQNGAVMERGTVGFYWTSSCTDWEQIDAFIMQFAAGGYQNVSSSVSGTVYSLRRYHTIDDI